MKKIVSEMIAGVMMLCCGGRTPPI
jgi:hypothetical protein